MWGHGYVWIGRVKQTEKAIKYILKYIQKAFDEVPKGHRRYWCSQGLSNWSKLYSSADKVFDSLSRFLSLNPSYKIDFKVATHTNERTDVAIWGASYLLG